MSYNNLKKNNYNPSYHKGSLTFKSKSSTVNFSSKSDKDNEQKFWIPTAFSVYDLMSYGNYKETNNHLPLKWKKTRNYLFQDSLF